ncbi:Na+/H+ antiporter subunit E [Polymorphobacter sp.]|uniref:Na+/H+ antiporter subunit E n=1 Tax=Polymorphobacter sp. TaxID=1909290 RepID=UPI003F7014AA
MKRVLPFPVMTLLIILLWLALSPDPGRGTVLLALAIGLLLPLATRRFWPHPPRLRRPGAALRLIGRVLVDIVTANVTVARQVLGPPARLRPAFFEVPLSLDDPFVATLFGGIISLTPGTVTIDIEMATPERPGRLFVHGLDVPDVAATIASVKSRYEAPLKEIFGC